MSYSYQITLRVIYSAQYHEQHCTLKSFKQFEAMYMNKHNDKHPTQPEFEHSTSEFRATTGPNEPSGPATRH